MLLLFFSAQALHFGMNTFLH